MIIETEIPEVFGKLNFINEDEKKCPYCAVLFKNGKIFGCLSRSQTNFDVPYTNFFSDLNRSLKDI